MLPLISMIWRETILCPCDLEPTEPNEKLPLRERLAIHFDEHVTIDIAQRLHDPALCLAALFLIEVRGRFVRLDRHPNHQPFGFFALSEGSRHNGNSGDQLLRPQSCEPRFGLDIPSADGAGNALVSWNDLDWSKVVPAEEGVIDVLGLPGPINLPAAPPASDGDPEQEGQLEQYKDDILVKWDNGIDAANLAYVLYQVPMMVCVHAAEMLLKKKN